MMYIRNYYLCMICRKKESGLKDAKEFKEEMKDKKISSRFIDTISGVFTPILNLLIATGIIKCFLALMTATGLMDATAGTYQILSIAGDCFFYFMPVFLGYTAMKKIRWDSVCWNGYRCSSCVPVYCGHYGR